MSGVFDASRDRSPFIHTVEHVIKCLCGVWAFGLGFRFTLELLLSDGWIHVMKHPLNIWFDFLPLCLLGLLVTLFEMRNLAVIVSRRKPISV